MEPQMQGIDTNVLVRFLVQDDDKQSARATKIFEQISKANPAFLNNIVMCELVWVLSKAYQYEKTLIVDVIERLLSTTGIEFENTAVVRKALYLYENGNADFSDYLIAVINKEKRVSTTYTFDKKAGKSDLFTYVS